MLTAEIVRSLFDYDPLTGVLIWKRRTDLKPKAGSWNERNAGNVAGTVDSKGYICLQINKKKYRGHRIAWLHYYGAHPALDLDHKNGIKADNRIENLREATVAQNGHNVGLQARNSSGRRGVFWHNAAQKWQARICFEGKEIYLGLHLTFSAACAAREEGERKYYGEFARAA